jgi:hypothetical protein
MSIEATHMDLIVGNLIREGINKHRARELARHFIKHINTRPKAEKQEPVAYVHRNEYNEYRLEPTDNFKIEDLPVGVEVMLYRHPKPKREPLTDEQIAEFFGAKAVDESFVDFVRAIEAAHGIKEKNNG